LFAAQGIATLWLGHGFLTQSTLSDRNFAMPQWGLCHVITKSVPLALLLGAALPASGATINLNAAGGVSQVGSDSEGNPVFGGGGEEALSKDSLDAESRTVSFAGAATWGSGAATSLASANATTGALKVRVESTRTGAAVPGLPEAGAWARAEIVQDFTISGAGSFTVGMSVDAFWAAQVFTFAASVLLNMGMLNDVYIAPPDSETGRIDNHILSTTFESTGGTYDIQVLWSLFAEANAYSSAYTTRAMVDASNTGLIFFSTAGDLVATPTTAGFLSNPAYPHDNPAPVPLPAGLPLLATAMLGGVALSRRRGRQGLRG
jgi:hypothetical protein